MTVDITLSDIAAAFLPGDQPRPFRVELQEDGVLLSRDAAEECVLSIRDGRIDICVPLFAYSEAAAPVVMEWALDLNFRNPETGRIARHGTLPVLLLLDTLAPHDRALRDLVVEVNRLCQSADDLRQAVPDVEETRPVAAVLPDQSFIIFRA